MKSLTELQERFFQKDFCIFDERKGVVMLLREELIRDINSIESPQLLHQVFEYLKSIKKANTIVVKNKLKVLKFAGMLTQKQADKITSSVNSTFNKIEGEW